MGRRRRKTYKVRRKVVKKLPKTFQCPACGAVSISIRIDRDANVAFIACSNPSCRLRAKLDNVPKIYQEVDVYAKFLDLFSEGAIEVTYGGEEEEEEEERRVEMEREGQ